MVSEKPGLATFLRVTIRMLGGVERKLLPLTCSTIFNNGKTLLNGNVASVVEYNFDVRMFDGDQTLLNANKVTKHV